MQTLFTFSEYKDGGYQFVQHLLDICVSHLASGDDTDSATFYVAVLEKAELQEKRALIVSTAKGFDTHSVHVQNIEVLLRNKFNYSEVLQMTSAPKEIKAIIADAKEHVKQRSVETSIEKTPALADLEGIVRDAVRLRASDIHFYVHEDRAEAVYRVDGKFRDRTPLGRERALSIIAAGLNAQSADYRSVVDDREMVDVSMYVTVETADPKNPSKTRLETINLRTSKSGAVDGPHTVMRVIRTAQDATLKLHQIGMDKDILKMLVDSTDSPTGIILVTGPTGSGKSTTLTALYQSMNPERKVILLEDPVEYRIKRENLVQKPVYTDTPGLGFLDYLKNALRQDPDIIGITEMRDKAVIDVVIRAALTGALMISTIHANDTIATITRLVDEGVSPKVLAERNLFRAIVAQRLIPTLCPHCKLKGEFKEFKNACITNHEGCPECGYTGIKGRVLIAELIQFDDRCRELIAAYDMHGLKAYLVSKGWKGMTDRARARVEQGILDPLEARTYVEGLFGDKVEIEYPPIEFAS